MGDFDTFRTCRGCGFRGYMDLWFRKKFWPTLLAFVLLFAAVIPGVLFVLWSRHRLQCPECGKLRN